MPVVEIAAVLALGSKAICVIVSWRGRPLPVNLGLCVHTQMNTRVSYLSYAGHTIKPGLIDLVNSMPILS